MQFTLPSHRTCCPCLDLKGMIPLPALSISSPPAFFTMSLLTFLRGWCMGGLSAQPQGPTCLPLTLPGLTLTPTRDHELHLCSSFCPHYRTQPICYGLQLRQQHRSLGTRPDTTEPSETPSPLPWPGSPHSASWVFLTWYVLILYSSHW